MNLNQLIAKVPHWEQAGRLFDSDDQFANLGHFHDALANMAPLNVSVVLALPSREGPNRVITSTRLIAVSRFRAAYSIITRVAHSLAPAIVNTGVVPVIQPIRESEVEELNTEFGFGRLLIQRGVFLWSINENI